MPPATLAPRMFRVAHSAVSQHLTCAVLRRTHTGPHVSTDADRFEPARPRLPDLSGKVGAQLAQELKLKSPSAGANGNWETAVADYRVIDNAFGCLQSGIPSRSPTLNGLFAQYCGGPGIGMGTDPTKAGRFVYQHNQLRAHATPLHASPIYPPGALTTQPAPYLALAAPTSQWNRAEDYFSALWHAHTSTALSLVESPWLRIDNTQVCGNFMLQLVQKKSISVPAFDQRLLLQFNSPYEHPILARALSESVIAGADENTELVWLRAFKLTHTGGESRILSTAEFSSWPDGAASHFESITAILQGLRSFHAAIPGSAPGSTAVNCLAGVGRTGTVIAVDMLSQDAAKPRMTNPFFPFAITLVNLRLQRPWMIQTEPQAITVFKCAEYLARR